MDQNYEIQKYPTEVGTFFNLQTAGKQFDRILPTVVPTIDLRELNYPVQSGTPPNYQFTAAGSQTTPVINAGLGLYRLRGVATLSGLNGATAGRVRLQFSGVLIIYELINIYVPAAGTFSESLVFDTLVDFRGTPTGNVETGFTTVGLLAPAGIADIFASISLAAQRIL